MSDSNEVSVATKPIAIAKALICLNSFSDKTYFALLSHPGMR